MSELCARAAAAARGRALAAIGVPLPPTSSPPCCCSTRATASSACAWPSDLGAWWDVYGAELPSGALAELMRRLSRARARSPAAAEGGGEDGGPAGGADHRGDAQAGSARAHGRAAGESQSALQPVAALCRHGIDRRAADAAGGFGAFVRRQLLPPPEVLDQQAGTGRGGGPDRGWVAAWACWAGMG